MLLLIFMANVVFLQKTPFNSTEKINSGEKMLTDRNIDNVISYVKY